MWRVCLLSGIILSGCCCRNGKGTQEQVRFFEDGRAKPIVVITPVVDITGSDLGWSLSDELTTLVVKGVKGEGTVCVVSGEEYGYTENPFAEDISWMKREFEKQEFVAFLELVEHETAPVDGDKEVPFETAMNLKVAVRLRLVDVRGEPKVILQEIVRDTWYIPRTMIPTDYRETVWGTNEYGKSPMGKAHMRLVEEISNRIRDYLQLAKSR